MSAVLNQPVVIDNGTGIIKAGFAGADKPKVPPVVTAAVVTFGYKRSNQQLKNYYCCLADDLYNL